MATKCRRLLGIFWEPTNDRRVCAGSIPGAAVAENRDQRETYLAQAREAEERAARTSDPVLKEGWLRVAEGYRHLADRLKRRDGGENV